MTPHSSKNTTFLLLLGILVVLLRLPYSIEPFWVIDEASYASVANKMVDGGLLYRDAWDNKPPFVYYFYMAIFSVFGKGNMLAVHVATLPFILVSLWLVYRIATHLASTSIAQLSVASYALYLVASPNLDVMAANTEIFLAPVMSAAIYLVLLGLHEPRWWLWFASGGLLAVASAIKQPGLLFCLAVPLFVLIQAYPFSRTSLRNGLRQCLWAFGGFVSVIGALLLFLWHQDITREFVEAVILFNTAIHIESIPAWQSLRMAFYTLFSYMKLHFTPITVGLVGFCLCVRGLISALRKHDEEADFIIDERAQALLLTWFSISLLAVSLGKRFYGFYFFLLAPALSIFIGLGLEYFRRSWLTFGVMTRRVMLLFLVVGIAYPLYLFHGSYLSYTKTLIMAQLGYPYRLQGSPIASLRMKLVSRFIETNTAINDRIFVWGYQPEIYVLSGRNFASRYNTVALQTGFIWGTIHQMSGWGYLERSFYWIHPEMESFSFKQTDTAQWVYPGSMKALLQDLQKAPPELFIDGNVAGEWPFGIKYPIASFPEVQRLLDREYRFEQSIGGYRVYRRKPRENHAADNPAQASGEGDA